MDYKTYYESGSSRRGTHKIHRSEFDTRVMALQYGRKISKKTRGYVSIIKGSYAIAECYMGTCKIYRHKRIW